MSTDRIEKQALLRAPLDRVWGAISNAEEFGRWFGVRFDGPFVAGRPVTATITPTTVDAKVAKRQEPHARGDNDVAHRRDRTAAAVLLPLAPCAGEPDVDLEPTTLVEFTLSETPDGVLLTTTESGFDSIPTARRSSSFEANSEGWAIQADLVRQYLDDARV